MAPIKPAIVAAESGSRKRIAAKLSLPSTDKGPGPGASGDQRQARDIVHAVDHAERRCADGRENSEAKYRDGRHTPCGYERRARGCTWHGAVAHLMHDCLDGQDLAHLRLAARLGQFPRRRCGQARPRVRPSAVTP